MSSLVYGTQEGGRTGPQLARSAAFLLGLSLQFNPLSSTWGGPFLRLSDAMLFVASGIFLLYLRSADWFKVVQGAWAFLALACAALVLKDFPGQGDTYFTLTLIASYGCAAMFLQLGARDQRLGIWFSIGTIIGFTLAVVILFLRAGGLDLTSIGLGVPTTRLSASALLAIVKPGGLWVHGNEAGHVFAIAGASAIYLSFVFRKPQIYFLYYILFLASFTVTLNRGGVIAPTIGLFVAYMAAGKGNLLMKLLLGLLAGVVLIVSMSLLPAFTGVRESFAQRFLMDQYLDRNVFERFETLRAGILVVLKHPFGIGYNERVSEMIYAARIGTPHNAFISLGFQAGVGMVALYIWNIFWIINRARTYRSLPILMLLFSAPSMFFEELTLNPVVLFSIALVMAEGARTAIVLNSAQPARTGAHLIDMPR